MLILLLLLSLVSPSNAQTKEKVDQVVKIITPKAVVTQFAGDFGMLSIGPAWEYQIGRRMLEVDAMYGYVPSTYTKKDDLHTINFRVTFLPWTFQKKDWVVRPLRVGAFYNYTLNDEYYSPWNEPDKYNYQYYGWTSAGKLGFAVGSELGFKYGTKEVAFYYDILTNDKEIDLWRNNTSSVFWADIFHLALGLRFRF